MKLSAIYALAIVAAAQAPGEVQTGYYRGQQVYYEAVEGMAIAEGDILLGTVEELAASRQSGSSKDASREAIAQAASRYRWPDAVIPYEIGDVPNRERVLEAVAEWNGKSPVRLVERTNQPNWLRFRRQESGCSSFVGMIGIGRQDLNLSENCDLPAIIHEIGHAAGLFHEQARQDRDFYLRVLYENLDKREFTQYNQRISDGVDVGSYDYGSIMHYSLIGFSRNGLPVMESVPRGIPIGQRDSLSTGDLDALKRLYGQPTAETVVDTVPAGLDVIVDGERFKAPKAFQWAAGTTHTIEAPGPQGAGNTRHLFARWSDDGERVHTIQATPSAGVYTANYIRQHKVPFTVAPAQGGTLRLSVEPEEGYFTEGTVLEVTASPRDGYHFAGWGGRGFFSIHGTSPNPLRFTVRSSDLRYTASFTRAAPVFVTSDPPGLEVLVNGEKTTTPAGFLWDPGSPHTISVDNTTQTNPSETARYLFRGWSDGGETSHEIIAGTEGGTYTARFQTQYLVTWNSIPGNGGTLQVSPFSADGFYDSGSTLQFSPLASGAFRFAGWGNDLSGSPAPGLLLVDDQKLVTGVFAVPGQLLPGGVVNAASFRGGSVAPGEIVTTFGLDLGPQALTTMQIDAVSARVGTALAGVRLLFDGAPAPLIYVSGSQISAVVPYSVAGRQNTRVQLDYRGQLSESRLIPVAPSAPALFTFDSSGRGPAAALNQNGSVNTNGNPAVPGSAVVLYATGEGQTDPGGIDGKPGAGRLPKPELPVRVRIGGRNARVEYAGGAPGLVAGVMQVNVRIPDDSPSGAVPVVLTVGEASSPASVTIAVQ